MSAVISNCGRYRYSLGRPCETLYHTKGTAAFLMLNPSTADAEIDDATITRCRGFARTWECNGLEVANLYALRSTDPNILWNHNDPIGYCNDAHLYIFARKHVDIVCAWGADARPERVAAVVKILKEAGARLWCLGVTKNGSPRHPLYIKADQPLIEWIPV